MTGPPFDPYPASAGSVRERAYDLVDRADELPPIVDAVGQATGVAQSAVSGVLVGPIGLGPNRFARQADRFRLTLLYTAGCLAVYADALGVFNHGIARLNAIWHSAVESEFGVPAVSPDAARTPHGTDVATLTELATDRTAAVVTARAELAARLRARYHRMEGAFDQVAGDVAGWIRRGPNPHTLRALVDHGVLRELLDSMPVDPDTLGVHEGYCDPQGYSSCGYRYGDDPGFRATAKEIGSMPWKIGEAGANWLYLDDARAALAGDKAAMAWLALDVAAGPLGRAAGLLRHSDEALEALHDAENTEDALDATRMVPGGGLLAHEGDELGHTIDRHVGKTDDELTDRLFNDPYLTKASSFTDRTTAEHAVADVLDNKHEQIETWLAGQKRKLELDDATDRVLGRYVDDSSFAVRDASSIRVVIFRNDELDLGYYIKTAFPRP